MRRLIAVMISLLACSCADQEPSDEEKLSALTGRWQLVEKKVGIGSRGSWQPVDEGPVYQLNTDSTFFLSEHPACVSGFFHLTGSLLFLNFECPTYDEEQTYYYSLSTLQLTLSPATVVCTEGCQFKYKKL